MPTAFDNPGYETARLRVAPLSARNIDAALAKETAAILSPQVTAFLPPSLQFRSEPDAGPVSGRDWLMAAMRDGTLLTMRARQGGGLLGFVLLGQEAAVLHVGYLLGQSAWGQGYGSEVLRGLVARARESGEIAAIVGGVSPDNAGSVRVLVKAGFSPCPDAAPDGSVFYRIELGKS